MSQPKRIKRIILRMACAALLGTQLYLPLGCDDAEDETPNQKIPPKPNAKKIRASAQLNFKEGKQHFSKGDFRAAIDSFEQAIILNDRYEEPRSWRIKVQAAQTKRQTIINTIVAQCLTERIKRPKPVVLEYEKEILTKLEKTIRVDYKEAPISTVLSDMNDKSNVNYILDPAITEDKNSIPKITFSATEIKTKEVLEAILAIAKLQFTIRNHAVFISTPTKLVECIELRIIDGSDLIHYEDQFAIHFNPYSGLYVLEKDKIVFRKYKKHPIKKVPDLDLVKTIKAQLLASDLMPPDSSIEKHFGRLVIMARPKIHDRIEKALKEIRKAFKAHTLAIKSQMRK